MYSRRARLLGYALDVGVHFLAALPDQVGGFVDDDHDVRNGLRHVGSGGLVLAEESGLRERHAVVEIVDVPHSGAREQLEPLFHLGDRPVQREDDFPVVCDDGNEQMGNRRVRGELHALRVYHYELQLLRRARHEQSANERVEADRLALARRAGDKHVRHRRQVGHELLPVRSLAEEERQLRLRVAPCFGLEYFAERYARRLAVRDLDAYPVLPGNRRFDSYGRRVERAFEVVNEIGHGRIASAGGQLDRILRYDRTFHRVAQLRVDSKEREG